MPKVMPAPLAASFSSQLVSIMSMAVEAAYAEQEFPQILSREEIAKRVLAAASQGIRDIETLKRLAML